MNVKKIGKRPHLLQVHLEGQADDRAYAKLDEFLKAIINKYDACIYDPQQDTFTTRDGQQSITRTQVEPQVKKTASLSFFFDQTTAFTDIQRLKFFELVEALIPKALPRRYGHYEPMQYTLAENGKEHFLQSWRDDNLGILWRGSAPFQWVYTNLKHSNSSVRKPAKVFVCQKVEIQFSGKLLETKKPLSQLILFQIEASKFLKVFYSEIRFADAVSQRSWRGLPIEPSLTAIIGEPYASLWPDFTNHSDELDTHLYMRRYLSSEHDIPKTPIELIAPEIPKENPLNSGPPIAQVFPFEIPKRFNGIPDRYKALKVTILNRAEP